MSRTRAEEARDLAGKVLGVGERMKADFESVAAAHGLTALQARTLLGLDEPSRMGDVAGAMTCDASNVTGLADRLERLGLIERTVDPHDRRVKLLKLTKEGRKRREGMATAVGRSSAVFARLSAAERADLEEILDKLLAE